LALGEIFAQIIDADIPFSELENADVSVFLNAASKVNLEILLDSQLVTEALINILSGEAGIEGLDILSIPDGIEWRDTYDGDTLVPGELRNILAALNAISAAAADLDFANLDINMLTEMDDSAIETFFGSYVIRATVTDLVREMDLGSLPLVFPDDIYDDYGYFSEDELIAVVKAVKLIMADSGDGFDIIQALSLTPTEIDTLLDSQIIYATVGQKLYELGSSTLIIPSDALTTVEVNTADVSIVNDTEIKNILQALSVLGITDLDTMSFDAGILSNLENSTEDDLDDAKITTLLASSIINATVSDMIINLDEANGGMLTIPVTDASGTAVKTYDATNDLYLISSTEINHLLKALYGIGIDDFDTIDLEDTSLITDNLTLLLDSAIIHATVSKTLIDLSGTVIIPEKDVDNQDITIVQGTTTFIDADEIDHLFKALDMLGFTDPNDVNTDFDFTLLALPANQDTLLDSAIMHATVSDRIFTLASGSLIVPIYEEDGLTEVRVEKGSLGNETEYIVKPELKNLFTAMNTMGFTDFNDVNSGVASVDILDHDDLIYTSSILQATISDQILSNTSGNLVVPDHDEIPNDIRIELSDVTYIRNSELENFITAINLLEIDNFNTFDIAPSDIFSLDLNAFFDSYIMQATVSKYVLDNSDDETALPGTTKLLVPTEKREGIDVAGNPEFQIEKQELINIIIALDTVNMDNFDDQMSALDITALDDTALDTILTSASFHVTVDNMLKDNDNVNANIPNLAQVNLYGVLDLTTKEELIAFIVAVNTVGSGTFSDAN
ncbi:MAG TPA: hypothetical protein PK113_03035, partial [Bacillota bacterium]|nr:hypothetical protein [Bacillota bacterium]